MDIKEKIKDFIVEKVSRETSVNRPYFFIRGSGLRELCQRYNLDLLKIVDELHKERRLRKGLINGRLVIYIHQPVDKRRLAKIESEFESFLNR